MDVVTAGRLEALGRAVKVVQWKHHRALDIRMREFDASIVQWDVLRALDSDPAASAHDLAVATFQSDQAVGTLTRRMISKGFIERAVVRGRRFEHRITDRGREVLVAGRRVAHDVFSSSFAELDDVEQATLAALLERVGATPITVAPESDRPSDG